MVLFALTVSFSRIQLGVHYPSDVIFGCFIGIIGFLLTIYLTGPLIFQILIYIENYIGFEIQYRRINSILFENIAYFLLVISILLIIFLLAINKKIKEHLKKN